MGRGVRSDGKYFGNALRAALGGGRASRSPAGCWRRPGLPPGRRPPPARYPRDGSLAPALKTHRTDLLTVLEVVNKRSQNFYAESVLKAARGAPVLWARHLGGRSRGRA